MVVVRRHLRLREITLKREMEFGYNELGETASLIKRGYNG